MGLIDQISQTGCTTQPDCTSPPTLQVRAAMYANVSAGSTGVDPFFLELSAVEPGARLEFVNLSANPAAEWGCDATQLPVDTNKQPTGLPHGTVNIVVGDDDCKKMGIEPGDTLALRQVDAAGNASPAVTIKMGGATGNYWHDTRGADQYLAVGSTLTAGNYLFANRADTRAPTAIPRNLTITSCTAGAGKLAGCRAVEPDATVALQNQRTGKIYTAKADDTGAFELAFEANVGDPIEIAVIDRNNMRTDLGVTKFAPVVSAAGALAMNKP